MYKRQLTSFDVVVADEMKALLRRIKGQHIILLSCDNGHARHPNHPELADANEAPVLNGGVVVKHSPRYATDAVSALSLIHI